MEYSIFRNQAPEESPGEGENISLPSDHNDKSALIMRLGRVLLALGSPAHRIETTLTMLANRLHLDSQFFSTPTALIASLGNERQSHTHLVRVESTTIDLGKLSDILGVMDRLSDDDISIRQASMQVADIYNAPPRYGALLTWLAFALLSASAALFLGGGWAEVILAGLIGCTVGLLNLIGNYSESVRRLFVPAAATLGSIIATVFIAFQPGTDMITPVIAGLIILIPGMDLTVSTRELASGHLVSGSARMAGAIMVLMTILFGLAVGSYIGEQISGPALVGQATPVASWIPRAALFVVAFAFTILFRARAQDGLWILLSSFISVYALSFSQQISGPIASAALAAAIVGTAANIFTRISRKPSSIIYVPGLLLLVPGAMGFRSLNQILEHNIIAGLEGLFNVFITAVALATGMVISSVLVPSKNEL
ncbi:MAG: threonine/serine exporter family protein [Xanthomonadales bacterium]|nr:threonine/serine exporter family protein [Xanthomonadales bacterium]